MVQEDEYSDYTGSVFFNIDNIHINYICLVKNAAFLLESA
jgi:hypothetical protein